MRPLCKICNSRPVAINYQKIAEYTTGLSATTVLKAGASEFLDGNVQDIRKRISATNAALSLKAQRSLMCFMLTGS